MGKISNEPVVYIKATVESAQPERVQWKPYLTTLTFDRKLVVEVPVPKSEVLEEGGQIILTLQGWTAFLNNYTKAIEKMNDEYRQSFMR